MRTIITSAFSLNMLEHKRHTIHLKPLSVEEAREYLLDGYTHKADWESAVGHSDTAAVFSEQLGQEVEMNRTTVHFTPGTDTRLLVGQYSGPRLEPGTTTLPEDATILWWLVTAAAY